MEILSKRITTYLRKLIMVDLLRLHQTTLRAI